ncbi:Imm49 family immunity protein [Kitasatospora albolonga]|uniref:Imm49 family immunity protein n=1 Tax=Kitasatospora albolonga TaxID=68173 RepID=UPI0031F0AF39
MTSEMEDRWWWRAMRRRPRTSEKLVETLDGILQRAFRREPLTVLGLSMATDKALILARKRALLDPAVETVESWYAWTAAMQASSAVFAAVGTGGSVVVRLGSAGVREVQAVRPDHYTDAGSWLDAFWLAVVCREARRLGPAGVGADPGTAGVGGGVRRLHLFVGEGASGVPFGWAGVDGLA